MASSSVGMMIAMESKEHHVPLPTEPKKSLQHVSSRIGTAEFEINALTVQRAVIPSLFEDNNATRQNSPRGASAIDENEDHAPAGSITEQVQTIWSPYMNRYRVGTACLSTLGNGMNDSAPGALIASIEKHYNISYGTVSVIFVCNALGFIAAAFFISALSSRIGRAKSLMVSEALLMLGYATIVTTPPFPVVCAAFFVLGVGMAINLAICQVFCSNLANNTAITSIYQGAYGIGGIIGPLIATSLVSHGSPWSRFYLIELGLATLNFVIIPWAFWNYELESDHDRGLPPSANEHVSGTQRRWKSIKTLLSHKTTVLGALFIFAYQGSEVAISGWVIAFLVKFRHGDPSKVGYVTSGFWAGITLGRLTLSFLAHRVGEKLFVFLVTAGALVLELLIWFVPSIPGDSVAVALSGLLLGPCYPCAVHVLQRLTPRKMLIASLSFIGSVGSSGGALAPFMTGMLAQYVGTFVLRPIVIGLFCGMALTWYLLPKTPKRDD